MQFTAHASTDFVRKSLCSEHAMQAVQIIWQSSTHTQKHPHLEALQQLLRSTPMTPDSVLCKVSCRYCVGLTPDLTPEKLQSIAWLCMPSMSLEPTSLGSIAPLLLLYRPLHG